MLTVDVVLWNKMKKHEFTEKTITYKRLINQTKIQPADIENEELKRCEMNYIDVNMMNFDCGKIEKLYGNISIETCKKKQIYQKKTGGELCEIWKFGVF